MTLPANVDTGLVTGRFLVGVIDGPDPDSEPEGLPARGTVTFTASVPYLPNPLADPAPVTILKAPIVATLDADGYLTVPDGTRGVRLVATDDADLSVQGWTWTVTYAFEPVNGVRPQIASHSMALPGGASVDLTSVVRVPSSTGIGIEQAEALAASASAAAIEASAAAVLASEAAQATDVGVAELVTSGVATRASLDALFRAHVSVKEYGAHGDGTTDDTTAVRAALVAGAGGTVYFPPGHYRLTGALPVPSGTTVAGAGSEAVTLDWSTMTAFTAASLMPWDKGTVTSTHPLTAGTAMGDQSVTVEAGHGLTVGDMVRVCSDEVFVSGEATRAEFQRVQSVDGATVTFAGPLFDAYTVATGARVEKMNLSTGGLSGVSIRGKGINPDGYGDTVVEFSLAQDVAISDVKFRDVENKCLLLCSVIGLTVSDVFFHFDPSFTPLQYGVALTGACQMVSIRGVHSWNDRHMITTSTSSTTLASRSEYRGIPRIVSITGCTAYGSWQSPIDTHRGGEYISIVGNSLTSESAGIKIRGSNVLISGNTLIGKRASSGGGPNGVYVGMLCDGIQIVGNTIRGFRDGVRFDTPDQPTRALIVSGNHISDCERPVFIGSTSTMSRLKIDGNYLRALPGSNNYPIYLVTTVEDIEITGNTLEGGNMGVYVASPTLPVTRALVQNNVVRGQLSFGMFFRNLTDALVTGNHVKTSDIRFTGTCVNVTTGLNLATITDLTTGQVVTQK